MYTCFTSVYFFVFSESSAKIMKRSGRICIADDVANMYSIKDIDGK